MSRRLTFASSRSRRSSSTFCLAASCSARWRASRPASSSSPAARALRSRIVRSISARASSRYRRASWRASRSATRSRSRTLCSRFASVGHSLPRVVEDRRGLPFARRELFVAALELLDQRGHVALVLRHALFGARDHLVRELEPASDRNAVRSPRHALDQPVGRRERGGVELQRRVDDAVHLAGKLLERAEVGRRDRRACRAR